MNTLYCQHVNSTPHKVISKALALPYVVGNWTKVATGMTSFVAEITGDTLISVVSMC